MISLWISQGENVTSGAVGPMMLGSFSVPVVSALIATNHISITQLIKLFFSQFAVAMSQLAPALGAFLGALVSYIIAIVTCSIPIAFILKKLESRYTQLAPEEDKKGEAVNGHEEELAARTVPEIVNGVEHVTDGDAAVTPLEEEIGDREHKD